MIVNMCFVSVGADDEGVPALSETDSQLPAYTICFLRGDLTRDEGLAKMVGDHIVRSSYPACFLDVALLGKEKLLVSDSSVALIAGDQLSLVGFFWILHIVDDAADGCAEASALANVQRHQAGSGH